MSEVRRIVVTGTESTGKTRLTQILAALFGEPWSPEYVREYWDSHDGNITAADLEAIGRGQMANEEAAAAKARRVVFFDTDLVSCALWNDLLFPGAGPGWVRVEAGRRSRRVALYLLCEADVPFAPDPQRCFADEAERQRTRRLWREAMVARRVPFADIRGGWAERERDAIAAVERVLRDQAGGSKGCTN